MRTEPKDKTYTIQEVQYEFKSIVHGIFERLHHDRRFSENPINMAMKYTVGELEQITYAYISHVLHDRDIAYEAYKKLYNRREATPETKTQTEAFDLSKLGRR
jgi:hypothetical protein